MSCIGIDLGTFSTAVAVAKTGNIDVVINDMSNRLTPLVVTFGNERRMIGENGITSVISNFRNSVMGFKRLLERRYIDPDITKEALFAGAPLVEDEGEGEGTVCTEVIVKGERRTYSFIQILAMYLAHVSSFTQTYTGSPIKIAVLSCPLWYTDIQKRAVLDACQIVGIEPIMLINDLAAASLYYGIMKPSLPSSKDKNASPKVVLLFDMGYSSMQACITKFYNTHATIVSHVCNKNIGGRDIDQAMASHYAAIYSKKYDTDISPGTKAFYKLRQASERAKKILSANPFTILSVESLVGDEDVSVRIDRKELVELIKPILPHVKDLLDRVLSLAKYTPDDIDCFELIGGSTRVPCIRDAVFEVLNSSKLTATLNTDEVVARGCAIQCAIASPNFRVRDYRLSDWNPYPLELHYDIKYSPASFKRDGGTEVSSVVFPMGCAVPNSESLTLTRVFNECEAPRDDGTYDFVLGVRYHEDIRKMDAIQLRSNFVNTFIISGIKRAGKDCTGAVIKLQLKLGHSGVVSIEDAFQIEKVTRVVPVKLEPQSDGQAAKQPSGKSAKGDTSGNEGAKTKSNGESADIKTGSARKGDSHDSESDDSLRDSDSSESDQQDGGSQEKFRDSQQQTETVTTEYRSPLKVTAFGNRKSQSKLQEFAKIESELTMSDILVVETAEMRNKVEDYVYSTRCNVSEGPWAQFATPEEGSCLLGRLEEVSHWLYDEGSYATKSEYLNKYKFMKEVGDKIEEKYNAFLEEQRKEQLRKEEQMRKIMEEEEKKKQEEELNKKEEESSQKIDEQPEQDALTSDPASGPASMDVSEPDSDGAAAD